jgi:hypothetical protein
MRPMRRVPDILEKRMRSESLSFCHDCAVIIMQTWWQELLRLLGLLSADRWLSIG